MQSELSRIGIHDTASGRQYIEQHLNGVLNDPSNIRTTQERTATMKELPGMPEIKYTATIRESLLMGPGGSLKVESVWDGDRLLTIILKGGQ